jgi:hypothetical protein
MKSPWTSRHEQAIGSLIPWSWICGCVVLAAVVLLLLTGCASSHNEMVKVKEVRSIVVAWNKAIPESCGPKMASDGYAIHGCASVWQDQLCTITMVEDSPDWVIAHEFRHCFGWAHK